MNKTYSLLILVVAFSLVLTLGLTFEPLAENPSGFTLLDLVSNKLTNVEEKTTLENVHDPSDTNVESIYCNSDEDCDTGELCGNDALCHECTDSDGGNNPLVKGYSTGVVYSGNYIEESDYCLGDGRLYEFYCSPHYPGKSMVTAVTCDTGYQCYDGACRDNCESDADCSVNEYCRLEYSRTIGVCAPTEVAGIGFPGNDGDLTITPECMEDADCTNWEHCESGICESNAVYNNANPIDNDYSLIDKIRDATLGGVDNSAEFMGECTEDNECDIFQVCVDNFCEDETQALGYGQGVQDGTDKTILQKILSFGQPAEQKTYECTTDIECGFNEKCTNGFCEELAVMDSAANLESETQTKTLFQRLTGRLISVLTPF